MRDDHTPDLDQLSDLLTERANRLAVHDDLDAILTGTAPIDQAPTATARLMESARPRASWLLAAAAALVAVTATAYLIGQKDETVDVSAIPPVALKLPWPFAADVREGTVIVWLEPMAESSAIEVVASWLDNHPAVDHYDYIDQDATYAEFADYYSDQPEVRDLVTPDQLPTSFRVTTPEPSVLAPILETFAGVSGVDVGS